MISQREMYNIVNRIFIGTDNRAHLLSKIFLGSSLLKGKSRSILMLLDVRILI